MDLPQRKKIRLDGYDYSSCGVYYITICVKEKQPILWVPNVGANCVRPIDSDEPKFMYSEYHPWNEMLSDIGKLVYNEIQKIHNIYDKVTVGKHCIMPDHIHMIIFINDSPYNFEDS